MLALASPVMAQTSPTDDTYGGTAGSELGQSNTGGGSGGDGTDPNAVNSVNSAGNGSGDGSDDGSLPFTGAELWIIALAGAGLIAGGVALRRTTRGHAGA